MTTEPRPSRLPALADEAPLVTEIFARLRAGSRAPLNLHRTLAHAPGLLGAMLGLAEIKIEAPAGITPSAAPAG